jgi:hypothetical protein
MKRVRIVQAVIYFSANQRGKEIVQECRRLLQDDPRETKERRLDL